MKEPMALEFNKIENPPSPYNKVMGTIGALLKNYTGNDKKKYLISKLSDLYGSDLALEIINSFPDDFFNKKEEIISEEQQEVSAVAEVLTDLPEGKKEEVVLDILEKKYKVPKEKIKEAKKKKNWVSLIGTVSSIAGIIIATFLIKDKEKKEDVNTNDKEKNGKEISIQDSIQDEKIVQYNERFNIEVYNSLPEQAKEIYKNFSEKNPTPNRGYQILDKTNAKIYLFNEKNELITNIPAGFGKDMGDEPNTSTEDGKGTMTTPAGIYLISNSVDSADIKEYGELQFSLFGVSILGDKFFLGQHQTYKKDEEEFKSRTKKLNSKKPNDNNFSDGCINIRREDFEKFIKPYFKGDNSELLFVLQDKKSKESGAVFNYTLLIQQIFPIMLDLANQEERLYEQSISSLKDMINLEFTNMANLQNKQNELTIKYNKNKENNSLQEKIHEIKESIKEKKEFIGKKREELGKYNKKMNNLEIRKKRIEEMLMAYS